MHGDSMVEKEMCPIRLIAYAVDHKIDPACDHESCAWWDASVLYREGKAFHQGCKSGCGLIPRESRGGK